MDRASGTAGDRGCLARGRRHEGHRPGGQRPGGPGLRSAARGARAAGRVPAAGTGDPGRSLVAARPADPPLPRLPVLLVAFIVGIGSAWARGLQIDCGCFGGGGFDENAADDYPWDIARDVGLLALSVWLDRPTADPLVPRLGPVPTYRLKEKQCRRKPRSAAGRASRIGDAPSRPPGSGAATSPSRPRSSGSSSSSLVVAFLASRAGTRPVIRPRPPNGVDGYAVPGRCRRTLRPR